MNINAEINKWKEFHEFLDDRSKVLFREDIMEECNWSQNTFYRKLRTASELSNAERKAIAKIYQLPYNFLFPEPENVVLERHKT